MDLLIVVAAVIGGLVFVGVVGYSVSYNRLVRDVNAVNTSWATVDVELTNRHILIPNLIETVKAAAAHEQALLVRAAQANDAAVNSPHTARAATQYEPALGQAAAELIALRERYPLLNSQRNFLELQQQLALTEDRIAAARRYYNMRVKKLNRRCEAFPSNIIARRHDIVRSDYFEL